ncbi:MAG: flagellar hook-basal body complex protein FliE [Candidatus Magnetobacterium sp. LHC-1]|uniref:Flagellar hook-basal body complex protein FliE n=1 Tax=Candidatus Magnetobacterium casense TaxID=1455061 RepID=A0ABS6RU31_9BACT|nr:flagellar hook-basal body complex protein FliE [Candidatus Magnetobacterium casensis]MBF0608127.1 flagellar hook-basal body complex protein FliE [Nitrospirota bacterium]MBV6340137.1 flagellar hook-basal body complex protein FliE [Candidatus Magnetobacterium casensis]
MSEFKILGSSVGQDVQQTPTDRKDAAGGFDTALKNAFIEVDAIQKEADKAIEALATGGDVTQAVLAMEKADMSFQLMLEVRNKLLNAYDEVMRMQV